MPPRPDDGGTHLLDVEAAQHVLVRPAQRLTLTLLSLGISRLCAGLGIAPPAWDDWSVAKVLCFRVADLMDGRTRQQREDSAGDDKPKAEVREFGGGEVVPEGPNPRSETPQSHQEDECPFHPGRSHDPVKDCPSAFSESSLFSEAPY
jgi:hypothetical protein